MPFFNRHTTSECRGNIDFAEPAETAVSDQRLLIIKGLPIGRNISSSNVASPSDPLAEQRKPYPSSAASEIQSECSADGCDGKRRLAEKLHPRVELPASGPEIAPPNFSLQARCASE
jgi:hypothetical protein